jgi:hypothetical protein
MPGEWHGIASWAPGEETRLEVPGATVFSMQGTEGGLRLDPCVIREGAGFERQLLTQGWVWRGGQALEPIDLGPYGAATLRSSKDGWTAVAHPEADVVRLESRHGRVLLLSCDRPFGVGWVGRSLLVGTARRDVLLFEDLIGVLERSGAA